MTELKEGDCNSLNGEIATGARVVPPTLGNNESPSITSSYH